MSEDITDAPRLAIVTVTFNAADVIEGFMQSLRAQTLEDYLLVVVDNASDDATLERLAPWLDRRVQVIRSPVNTGAAEGNNIGIEVALRSGARHILLCNNDIEFGSAVLDDLVAVKATLPQGAVSPVLTYHDDPAAIWYADGEILRLGGVRCVHRTVDVEKIAIRAPAFETSYAPTTFLLCDRAMLAATGRLDDQFFAYWEDADLIWRARLAGFGIWVAPSVRASHKVSQSSGGAASDYSVRQYFRNQLLFTRKHHGAAAVLHTASLSLLRILLRALLRRDGPGKTRAKLAGLRQGWGLMPENRAASPWGATQ